MINIPHGAACAALITCTFVPIMGAEVTTIRDAYVAASGKLAIIEVRWKVSVEELRPGFIESDAVLLNRECRVLTKGDKRLYEVFCVAAPGYETPEQLKRRGLCYDGKSTWMLHRPNGATVQSGDRRQYFDSLEDFLALQGHPTEANFKLWVRSVAGQRPNVAFYCDLAAMFVRGGYDFPLQEHQRKGVLAGIISLPAREYKVDGSEQFEGTSCVVVSSQQDRLFLDPQRNYAVVGRELSAPAGVVATRYVCRDFYEAVPGVFLAKEIVMEEFAGAVLAVRHTHTMRQARFDIADDEFRLDLPPGAYVGDTRSSTPNPDGSRRVVGYRVPTSPRDLEAVARTAAERAELTELRAEKGTKFRLALIAGNVLLIAVALLLIVRRLRRQPPSQPDAGK